MVLSSEKRQVDRWAGWGLLVPMGLLRGRGHELTVSQSPSGGSLLSLDLALVNGDLGTTTHLYICRELETPPPHQGCREESTAWTPLSCFQPF